MGANFRVENVNIGSVVLGEHQHRDFLLTFAAGPVPPATVVTMPSGTIVKVVAGKLEPFAVGDTEPLAVLTYDVCGTAAGDVPCRAMLSGRVRKELLIIEADGDATNVDAAVIDQLRDHGILAIDVNELNFPDNQ